MAERVLVWGAGGHGRVVADLVRELGHSVVGFIDADPGKLGQRVESGGAAIVLAEEDLDAAVTHRSLPGNAGSIVLGIGDNAIRESCMGRIDGYSSPALVHPMAAVSRSATLAPGVVVLAGAVVNAGARVESGGIVNSGAIVEHDCVLGTAAHVSPGAVLGGAAKLGERSWIGAGAVVIQGICVGRDAIVGAGTVVIRDVEEGQTVVGVPAREVDRL